MLTRATVLAEIQRARDVLSGIALTCTDTIVAAASVMANALGAGNTIYFAGNGGSASQAIHLAAEFVGRFKRERRPLPAASLCENLAAITAIGNDYSYDEVFSRQVEAFCRPGDVLVLLSTSGSSSNVLRAAKEATARHVVTIGLTGSGGGALANLVDVLIDIPDTDVAHVQEAHLLVGHLLCSVSDTMIDGSHDGEVADDDGASEG